MTKISRKYIDPDRLENFVNSFWNAVTLMTTKDEIRLLFIDLFTHTEFKMFSKRLEIARRLLSNHLYHDIQRDLGVTSGTISNISNHLVEKGDGYRLAHKKLSIMEERERLRGKEIRKNMENPFRAKAQSQSKTVLGALLKTAAHALDKRITKTIREKSARKKYKI